MTNLALPIDQAARHIRTGNDRTTPESVLRVVRPIDLDPCSNPWSITKARVSFSKHEGEDGRAADWWRITLGSDNKTQDGLVFVNPPFGRGQVIKWARKIRDESKRGTKIATIVHPDFSTDWFEALTDTAHGMVLLGRVKYGGGGSGDAHCSVIVLHNCLTARPWHQLGRVCVFSVREAA